MNRFYRFILLIIGTLISSGGCQQQGKMADITHPPVVTEKDKPYANVYSMLDGVWEGTFYIYEDSTGQQPGIPKPADLDSTVFTHLPLRLVQTIRVHQEYHSETPYFQRVKIIDRYPDNSGREKVSESYGVNKVQNGKLWCVVQKPDELVVHHGKLADPHTIIWQRSLRKPQRIEYFRETVTDSTYRILGWGYYGNDDPSLTPKTWFYGDYKRKQ